MQLSHTDVLLPIYLLQSIENKNYALFQICSRLPTVNQAGIRNNTRRYFFNVLNRKMIFLKIKDSFEISVGTWIDPSHTNGKNNLILKPQHVLLWKKQNYKKTNSIYGKKI